MQYLRLLFGRHVVIVRGIRTKFISETTLTAFDNRCREKRQVNYNIRLCIVNKVKCDGARIPRPPIGMLNNNNKMKHYRQYNADTRSYYIFTSEKNVNLKFQGFPRGNDPWNMLSMKSSVFTYAPRSRLHAQLCTGQFNNLPIFLSNTRPKLSEHFSINTTYTLRLNHSDNSFLTSKFCLYDCQTVINNKIVIIFHLHIVHIK